MSTMLGNSMETHLSSDGRPAAFALRLEFTMVPLCSNELRAETCQNKRLTLLNYNHTSSSPLRQRFIEGTGLLNDLITMA